MPYVLLKQVRVRHGFPVRCPLFFEGRVLRLPDRSLAEALRRDLEILREEGWLVREMKESAIRWIEECVENGTLPRVPTACTEDLAYHVVRIIMDGDHRNTGSD